MLRARLSGAAGRLAHARHRQRLNLPLNTSTAYVLSVTETRTYSSWKLNGMAQDDISGAAAAPAAAAAQGAAPAAPAAGAAAAAAGVAPLGGAGGAGGAGPDPSRGYDVNEYKSIWQALTQEKSWPSMQRFSVVGPAGDAFALSVQARVVETLGWDAAEVKTEPRSRWQSVRLEVRCTSPDDFCALHSNLKSLEGVRFLL